MNRAFDGVIAPSREQVACIDHDRPFNGCRIYKLACGTLNLKPSAVILEKKGDGTVVLILLVHALRSSTASGCIHCVPQPVPGQG